MRIAAFVGHPKVIRELELRDFGLEVLPATDLFCPLEDDDYLIFSDDVARPRRSSPASRRRTPRAIRRSTPISTRRAAIVRKLLLETPVDPSRRRLEALQGDRIAALGLPRASAARFYRIVDLLTQSADDYLSRWFESDVIKAVLAYYASIGTFAGPKTPGSAYVIMHHLMGEHEGAGGWGFISGGMGAISQAIAQLRRALRPRDQDRGRDRARC